MAEKREPDPRGWDAISAALRAVHGPGEPLHWAAPIPYILGGRDPLQGIDVYRVDDPAHWHYVTYGMSELWEKETDDPEVSGWGLEYTIRVARAPDDTSAPGWPVGFLNNLARYVIESGNEVVAGHHFDLNGPIALGVDTAIRAGAFTVDAALGSIETPNGGVTFVQAVGLTLDELAAARAWDTAKVLALLQARDPLLITDLARRSYLEVPEVARSVAEGTRRDGSSQGICYVGLVEWSVGPGAAVTIGGTAAQELAIGLPSRLPFGRALTLAGKQALRFEPASRWSWRAEQHALVVSLPADACAELLAGIAARRGSYSWEKLPGLVVTVIPSEIKDRDGQVVQVVG